MVTVMDKLEAEQRRADELALKLVKEREQRLLAAYQSGVFWNDTWQAFDTDSKWLVEQLGLDPDSDQYDCAKITQAIPRAAQKVLDEVDN